MIRSRVFIFILMAFSIFYTHSANAIILPVPPYPGMPAFDVPRISVAVKKYKTLSDTLKETQRNYNELKAISQNKGVGLVFAIVKSDTFNSLNKKYLNGSRKITENAVNIEDNSSYDIHNPQSVETKIFDTLLIRKNGDNKASIAKHNKAISNFNRDSVSSSLATIDELEKNMEELDLEIVAFREITDTGSKDIAGVDTTIGVNEMEFQAVDIMDKIKRLELEFVAMDTMTKMTHVIKDEVSPISTNEFEEIKKKKNKNKLDLGSAKGLFKDGKEAFGNAKEAVDVAKDVIGEGKDIANEMFNKNDFASTEYIENPESDITSPFAGSRDAIVAVNEINRVSNDIFEVIALHNEIRGLEAKRDIFLSYEKQEKRHAKSLDLLNKSEACVVNYLGKYYGNPKTVWNGSSSGANNHENRQGLSRWFMDMYSVAKNDMNPVSDIDSMSGSVTDSSSYSDDLSKVFDKEVKYEDEGDSRGTDKKLEGEGRKIQLLSWQIGAAVSKSLAADQYGQNKWGKPNNKFPIWEDQKEFYNQYIEYKYDNILAYIKTADFRLAELDVVNALSVSADDINQYNEYKKWISILRKKVVDQQAEKKSQNVKTVQEEYLNMKAAIDSKRTSEIASYEKEIKSLQYQVVEAKKLERTYTNNANALEKNNLVKMVIDTSDPDHNLLIEKEGSISLVELKNMISSKKKEITNLENRMFDLYTKIEKVNKSYSTEYANLEYKMSKDAASYVDKGDKKDFETLVSIFNKSNLGNGSDYEKSIKSNFVDFLKDANKLIDTSRDYSGEIIEKYRNNYFALGEQLYLQDSLSLITNNHKKMMDEFTSVKPNHLIAFSDIFKTYSSAPAVLNAVASVYETYLVKQVCEDGKCYVPDEKYFVGAKAVARDFSSPKGPIKEYLPPLRETLYFDFENYKKLYNEKDYITVELPCSSGGLISKTPFGKIIGGIIEKKCKYKKYYVSKNAFLNSEIYMPQVWKLALSGYAFVERDIDMQRFLGAELPESKDDTNYAVEFYRAGQYPCRFDGKVIDVSKDASYFLSSNVTASNLPICGKTGLEGGKYNTVVDLTTGLKSSVGYGESTPRGKGSELGNLFYAYDNRIIYKEHVRNAFNRLLEIKKYVEEDKKYDEHIKDEIYGYSSFRESQLSSFITIAEIEETQRLAKEETKVSIDEFRDNLVKRLDKYGFSPRADLNLANISDFNLVQRNLRSAENNLASAISKVIDEYKDSEYALVKEKYDMLNDVIQATKLDKDNLISLSMNVESNADMQAEIKKEKANRAVVAKQQEEADKLKDQSLYIWPYCASY